MYSHSCPRNWVITKRKLGEGKSGAVYDTCQKGVCDWVSKIAQTNPHGMQGNLQGNLQRQIDIQNQMARLGIAPRLDHIYHCSPSDFTSSTISTRDKFLFDQLGIDNQLPHLIYIMQKIPGQTLARILQENKHLSKEDCKTLNRVFHTMHSKGILHNDLHAENIMRTPSGSMQIVDWENATQSRWGKPLLESQKWMDIANWVDLCPDMAGTVDPRLVHTSHLHKKDVEDWLQH
jgi:serine/threonine protein kinase